MRRGPLVLTVSTSGASPALARKIKTDLEEQFDEVYDDYVCFLQQARLMIAAKFDKGPQRRKALQALLEPSLLEWTRNGGIDIREAFLQQILIGVAR